MKIAILGFAKEGQAAFNYWKQAGNEITICDQNPAIEIPEGVQAQLGVDYLKNLGQFDLLVRTPALYPGDITEANPQSADILSKVTSITNEFFRASPTKNIIGVTGTKGKGTTSTLIAKILEATGKRVHLGGNIGTPLLNLLENGVNADDWVVMELSSFQLIDLKYSPHIAVCLVIMSEHMDWHEDIEEYIAAKQQLFIHQGKTDVAIYYGSNDNSLSIADASEGIQIPYFEKPGAIVDNNTIAIDGIPICKTSELKLLGKHNWQNICAAVTAVWQVTQDVAAIRSILTSFTGLEHRLEFVRELNGVKYYDDSFGTTPETAIVAIEAFEQPKVLILGGSDKGADFSTLGRIIINSTIRQVILIGNSTNPHYKTITPEIEAALRAQGVKALLSTVRPGGITMDEIVHMAQTAAQPGDVVLLSAACASFDMFKNYKDRGEQFKSAVQALA